jgi:hypothetical protein
MSEQLSEKEITKDIGQQNETKPVSNLLEEDLNREDQEEQADIPEVSVILRLGDILTIKAATNEILDNNTFIIEYINPTKIKLVNIENFEKVQLRINKDGLIGDGSITEIKVISSNPDRGYTRQNNLLPGTWINIYFGGDLPLVITGKITDLEEDMIEIKTIDNETIYINFEYYGIPEDLPIETFEIRPPPDQTILDEKEVVGEKEVLDADLDENQDFGEEFSNEFGSQYEEREQIKIPVKSVKDKINKMVFDADQIQFGDIMQVQEYVDIDKDKYRFDIETQTNDLLEEMISTIPSAKRTDKVLNKIHIMITRFIQLRETSSVFDKNKNITGFINKTANDRPLAEYLSEFKNTLYWIMMVAKNVKKRYVIDESDEYHRSGDMEIIPENENLLEMNALFRRYKSDEGIEGQNKYSEFYTSINKYMTPFSTDNPELAGNVFTSNNGVIVEGHVNSNMNAIIDNLGELYSTVVSKSNETTRKFVIQKYNLGLDKLHVENDNFKGPKMDAQRVKLTKNDDIAITSIVTLPEPTVRFSQINLPGSNLLVKANLNLHFLNYWQLLKQGTNVMPIEIDGLDNELEFNNGNFVDNIKHYMLNLSDYEMPNSVKITNLDIYNKFLKIIIPKIIVLFNLVKKYIKGKLSMSNLISYLEPFMIYSEDLTYMNYKEIDKFILEKIREYNSKFVEHSRAFSIIKSGKKGDKNLTTFFDILNSNIQIKNSVMGAYGYLASGLTNVTTSEVIKKITLTDYGNLFNTSVAFSNLALMYPAELNPLFEADRDKLKANLEQLKESDSCTSYVIAKKYYSMDKLLDDNDRPVYFDKEYDTTNYDMINDQFKKERETLDRDELELYITEQLIKKYKKNERDATYLADTLINQAKKVIDGQYAIISVEPGVSENIAELQYFIRKDDKWILAEEIDPKWFIQDPDILCNINRSCIYNTKEKEDEACESTGVSKATMVSNALKDIMKQFDANYKISKDELTAQINKHLSYFENIMIRIQELQRNELYKYNNKQYNIGLKVSEEAINRKISPYTKLCNLIVGQSDFVKQQNDIVLFATKYCRNGDPNMPNVNDNEMESMWWFYCKETDTKLIPAFRVILARTFVKTPEKYERMIEILIKQIGELGDNGSAWVDKNSGEVIRYIDSDVSEGYRDGFKDVNRSILEKDAADVTIETYNERQQKKEKRLSPEGQLVSNIITTITSNMGINLDLSRDYIIKIVTELMNDVKVIEKEPAYKEREKEAAKKGKKLPEYVLIYSSTLLYLSLGMILIAIQTSIPSIKTRKTFPGCVRSFSGFPFEGEGDDTGLDYLACVAYKHKNPHTIPWNALSKVNLEKATATIKGFIIKYLLPYYDVDQKIKEKIDYLLLNPEKNDVSFEHSLSFWTNFLPPLKLFHIKGLENISEGFEEELMVDIRSGNPKQIEMLYVIQSKISQFSLAIQEEIQKLVESKDLLLKNSSQPFMINACCSESGSNTLTALQYFIQDNANIDIYNKIVRELTALLRNTQKLAESAIMLSEIDTKRLFPEISNDFSDETIYRAFIALCNFQNSIPLTDDLMTICVDKPDYLSKSDSIHEKIAKLKRDDRNYNKEKFLRLFQIVSRNNIIKLSLSQSNQSCSDPLRKVLIKMDGEDDDQHSIAKVLRQRLEALLDTYDMSIQEDTEDMRQLKNYLAKSNENMRKELLEFIKRKSKISGSEFKKITAFISNLSVWQNDTIRRNDSIKISDDSMYNYINFYKNFISLLAIVFPTMILNKQSHSFVTHTYWKFAQSHNRDLKDDIEDYLKPLEKFYGNTTIDNVATEIQNKCKGIIMLSNVTPSITNTIIGDQMLYNVFDKRTSTLLYEYYILQIFTEYINLTKDPAIISQILKPPKGENPDLYGADFLVEQQLKFSESEDLFIEGNVEDLQSNVAKLLVSYMSIMMHSKKVIDVSYDKVEDIIFKLKEAEKYTFTDRLKDLDDEQRAVDNILKVYKLGVWSAGLTKGIKQYDPENYEHEKEVSRQISEIQNKLRRNPNINGDNMENEMEDALDDLEVQDFVDADELQMRDIGEDYDNGDPYGEERDDPYDY